jgi:G:T-mismatch repair DNA endonuclease (very short patch repair protein)
MAPAYEKMANTKRKRFAEGSLTNWTSGRTKDSDPRIAAAAEKISKTLTGKLAGDKNPFYGRQHTEETKQKLRAAYRKRCLENRYRILKTRPEKSLEKFIEDNKLPYTYTGNRKFWIEDVNPDFVNTNGEKKVLEVLGCYWHNCPIHFPTKGCQSNRKTDSRKELIYKKYGYVCVQIWEHDLVPALAPSLKTQIGG